jgi:hypothetical protein
VMISLFNSINMLLVNLRLWQEVNLIPIIEIGNLFQII